MGWACTKMSHTDRSKELDTSTLSASIPSVPGSLPSCDPPKRRTRLEMSVLQSRSAGFLDHVRLVGWFIGDSWRTARRPVAASLIAELASFTFQALAFGLLVAALSDPGGQFAEQSTVVAAMIMAALIALLLLVAEYVKFVARKKKFRLAYEYEADALARALRYSHRANRFDSESAKNLISRLPQVSGRVAVASIDVLVPAVVGAIASVALLLAHPGFTIVLIVGVAALAPLYFVVARRGRRATQAFYSPEGLNYIRSAALRMSKPVRGQLAAEEIQTQAQMSLRELEIRRVTPNLIYLVTGAGLAVTLGALVGYSVVLGRRDSAVDAALLEVFFILRFVYVGLGGVTGALSKVQILVPRVEPVLWALRGLPPPAPGQQAGKVPAGGSLEEDFDE